MSIEPDDWFNKFWPFGRRGRGSYFGDTFRGFDEMRREMERGLKSPSKT